jgi:hypothetical protein
LEQAEAQKYGFVILFEGYAQRQTMGVCHGQQQHATSLQVGRTSLVEEHGASAERNMNLKMLRKHTKACKVTEPTASTANSIMKKLAQQWYANAGCGLFTRQIII